MLRRDNEFLAYTTSIYNMHMLFRLFVDGRRVWTWRFIPEWISTRDFQLFVASKMDSGFHICTR